MIMRSDLFIMLNKLFCVLILLSISVSFLYSVPANPDAMVIKMPNGTELTIRQYGDESYHYATTEDGYLIDYAEDGFYYFVDKDGANHLYLTSEKACDVKKRSASTMQMLSKIDQTLRPSKTGIERKMVTKPAFQIKSEENHAKAFRNTGTRKALVLLAQYPDSKFSSEGTIRQTFLDKLNKEGYSDDGSAGSVHDFYYQSSRGKLNLNFEVAGPYTVVNEVAYYGANTGAAGTDIRPREFVAEVCLAAVAAGVDFSPFDTDGDGYVDNVYVIFAGKGEAAGGAATTIWPHSWALKTSLNVGNGKSVYTYACNAELNSSGNIDGMGTFIHEFGHVVGLPDLYDTNYYTEGLAYHLSTWSVMAQGCYNNSSKTPPQFSSVERYLLEWEAPVVLNNPAIVALPPLDGNSNLEVVQSYRINTETSGEYYILENRQRTGWDTYLKNPGMLVYHVDKSSSTVMRWNDNTINADSTHQCVELIKAYPTTSLTKNSVYTPFPGSGGVTEFTDTTNPSMKSWNGVAQKKPITDIKLSNNTITFKFMGGAPPTLNSVGTLLPFAAKIGQSSAIQTVSISGSNLLDSVDVLLLDDSNFDIKQSSSDEWSNAIVLYPVEGILEPVSVDIRYVPTTEGSHVDNIGIASTGAEDIYLDITGTVMVGDLLATRSLKNSTLDFGDCVLNVAKKKTIAIKASDLTADINLAVSGENAAYFTISDAVILKEDAASTLGAQVTVTYLPQSVDEHSAILTLTVNGDKLLEIKLKGEVD